MENEGRAAHCYGVCHSTHTIAYTHTYTHTHTQGTLYASQACLLHTNAVAVGQAYARAYVFTRGRVCVRVCVCVCVLTQCETQQEETRQQLHTLMEAYAEELTALHDQLARLEAAQATHTLDTAAAAAASGLTDAAAAAAVAAAVAAGQQGALQPIPLLTVPLGTRTLHESEQGAQAGGHGDRPPSRAREYSLCMRSHTITTAPLHLRYRDPQIVGPWAGSRRVGEKLSAHFSR